MLCLRKALSSVDSGAVSVSFSAGASVCSNGGTTITLTFNPAGSTSGGALSASSSLSGAGSISVDTVGVFYLSVSFLKQ
jgi:hypothetical protein